MQFVFELLIVRLAASMIGALIGALISKPISNSLLSSEIKSSMNSSEKIKGNFGGQEDDNNPFEKVGRGAPNIQAYDSIVAVVSRSAYIFLSAIAISLL